MDLVALLNLGRRDVKRVYDRSVRAPARHRHQRRPRERQNREPAVSSEAARTGSSRAH